MSEALLELGRFAPCVGAHFVAGDQPEAAVLKLVEAKALPGHRATGRQPFVLLFQSSHLPMLTQGLYRLANPTAGILDIFLVPVGRDSAGTLYEAIFN